jgi:hypothetical protein
MTDSLKSETPRTYKFPSVTTLGAVETKTAGKHSATQDGSIGFYGGDAPSGSHAAEVKIPARSIQKA